jgi:agmatinase
VEDQRRDRNHAFDRAVRDRRQERSLDHRGDGRGADRRLVVPPAQGSAHGDASGGGEFGAAENPRNFLGLPDEHARRERAAGVLLPVPYERTVSYGAGAAGGPAAIVEASRYVELYDHELDAEPWRRGIHTLPPLEVRGEALDAVVEEVAAAWSDLLGAGAFPILLGGEHTVSVGAVRATAERFGDLSVLQLDAHADLRDRYEGSPWSHACVMRRVAAWVPAVGVGIRALSAEEAAFARAARRPLIWGERLHGSDAWMGEALAALTGTVYLTFDVDFFDPSIVPATGTPEPGGGLWYPTLAFLRRLFAEKRVVAADVVELAPREDHPASSFLVARLVYKLFGYAFAGA